jgi:hypothetical protein
MVRTAYVLGVILSCASMSTSLACTPAPGGRPSSELRELQPAARSPEPAVVYPATYRYEIRVKPADLLEVIRDIPSAALKPDTFGGRLESLLPLQADMAVRDILTPLAPEAPAPDEQTLRWVEYRRFWRQSDQRLRYDLAVLLESGRATIVEKSSGTALTTVISLTFRESCFRTQRFIAPNGIIIMQIHS